jgi:hypothetical protein
VSITEELLGRKSSGYGLEIREYGRRDPLRRPRGSLYPQKLALTPPKSGGHSIGVVRSRTQATEFLLGFESVPAACAAFEPRDSSNTENTEVVDARRVVRRRGSYIF